MSILKQAESGTPVAALCREHGMSNATFYKWRAKYGGMDTSLMARLKELEAENTRLKKMYAEERLQAEIIQEAMAKKWRGHLADVRWHNRQLPTMPLALVWLAAHLVSVKPATVIRLNSVMTMNRTGFVGDQLS